MADVAEILKSSGNLYDQSANQRGLSLIELMITVVVFGILVGVAVPAYTEQVAKTRRADAKGAVLGLAQAAERFNTVNGTFTGAVIGNVANSIYPNEAPLDGNNKFYDLTLTITGGGASYTITAAPKGVQTGDKCGTFSLTSAGVKTLSGNTATAEYCGW